MFSGRQHKIKHFNSKRLLRIFSGLSLIRSRRLSGTYGWGKWSCWRSSFHFPFCWNQGRSQTQQGHVSREHWVTSILLNWKWDRAQTLAGKRLAETLAAKGRQEWASWARAQAGPAANVMMLSLVWQVHTCPHVKGQKARKIHSSQSSLPYPTPPHPTPPPARTALYSPAIHFSSCFNLGTSGHLFFCTATHPFTSRLMAFLLPHLVMLKLLF